MAAKFAAVAGLVVGASAVAAGPAGATSGLHDGSHATLYVSNSSHDSGKWSRPLARWLKGLQARELHHDRRSRHGGEPWRHRLRLPRDLRRRCPGQQAARAPGVWRDDQRHRPHQWHRDHELRMSVSAGSRSPAPSPRGSSRSRRAPRASPSRSPAPRRRCQPISHVGIWNTVVDANDQGGDPDDAPVHRGRPVPR